MARSATHKKYYMGLLPAPPEKQDFFPLAFAEFKSRPITAKHFFYKLHSRFCRFSPSICDRMEIDFRGECNKILAIHYAMMNFSMLQDIQKAS